MRHVGSSSVRAAAVSSVVCLLVAGCGPGVESNAVADAPPVPEDRDVVFTESTPQCERQKVGDVRVEATDWPAAREQTEATVREMGGEAVIGWAEREIVVDEGGAGGSGVPGASSEKARTETFYFGVVVRFEEDCPEA